MFNRIEKTILLRLVGDRAPPSACQQLRGSNVSEYNYQLEQGGTSSIAMNQDLRT